MIMETVYVFFIEKFIFLIKFKNQHIICPSHALRQQALNFISKSCEETSSLRKSSTATFVLRIIPFHKEN